MDAAEERHRLIEMVRRLLGDLESHGNDYHHVTPRTLLDEARSLLRDLEPHGEGGVP